MADDLKKALEAAVEALRAATETKKEEVSSDGGSTPQTQTPQTISTSPSR